MANPNEERDKLRTTVFGLKHKEMVIKDKITIANNTVEPHQAVIDERDEWVTHLRKELAEKLQMCDGLTLKLQQVTEQFQSSQSANTDTTIATGSVDQAPWGTYFSRAIDHWRV